MKRERILELLFLFVCALVSCVEPGLDSGRVIPTKLPIAPRWISLSWATGPKLLLVSLGIEESSELCMYDVREQTLSTLVEVSPSWQRRILRASWNASSELVAYADSQATVQMITSTGVPSTFQKTGTFVAWSSVDDRVAIADIEPIGTQEGYVASIDICDITQDVCSIVWQKSGKEVGAFEGIDWLPTGDQILFSLRTDGQEGMQADLYVLDIGSGSVRQLTSTRDDEVDPVWSPDGRWIAYVRRDSPHNTCLVVMSASFERTLEIAESDKGGLLSPAWSPDGKFLAIIERGSVVLIEIETILQQRIIE